MTTDCTIAGCSHVSEPGQEGYCTDCARLQFRASVAAVRHRDGVFIEGHDIDGRRFAIRRDLIGQLYINVFGLCVIVVEDWDRILTSHPYELVHGLLDANPDIAVKEPVNAANAD